MVYFPRCANLKQSCHRTHPIPSTYPVELPFNNLNLDPQTLQTPSLTPPFWDTTKTVNVVFSLTHGPNKRSLVWPRGFLGISAELTSIRSNLTTWDPQPHMVLPLEEPRTHTQRPWSCAVACCPHSVRTLPSLNSAPPHTHTLTYSLLVFPLPHVRAVHGSVLLLFAVPPTCTWLGKNKLLPKVDLKIPKAFKENKSKGM